LSFFLFGLDQTGREGSDVFFAERIFDADTLGLASFGGLFDRRTDVVVRRVGLSGFRCGLGFGAGVGEEPAGESAGRTARHVRTCGQATGLRRGAARHRFVDFRLRFVQLGLYDGSHRSGCRGLVAIFCE